MRQVFAHMVVAVAAVFALMLCGCAAVQSAVTPTVAPEDVPQLEDTQLDVVDDGAVDDRIVALQRPVLVNIHTLEDATGIIAAIGDTSQLVTFGSFVLGDAERAAIQGVIDTWEDSGRPVGFLLMDVETGAGVAYNIDTAYYSSSGIKAAYACAVTYYEPNSITWSHDYIRRALVESSNADYEAVFDSYNDNIPNKWRARAGLGNQQSGRMYTWYSVRDWARIWCVNWDYLKTDTETTLLLKEWLNGTYRDGIYAELGEEYTVYSKAGWDPSNHACNDAGIVITPNGTYLMVIMTDRAGYPDEVLGPMVRALDDAYQAYAPQKERETASSAE